MLEEEQHLRVPVVGRQRPAMAEHNGLISAVEGGPVRHPDPKHVRPIGSGVSYVAADGSRAEFKISDRLLKSSNLLSDQSFIIKTAAAITSKKPWYTRFESPITLELPGQSPQEGEGTLEYFELK
jgi:hypothetical protein